MLSLHLMDCLSRKKLNHFLFSPIDLESMGFLQESSAPVGQPNKGLRTDTWRFMHMHRDTAVAPCLMCLWKSSQSNLTKEPIAAPSSESPPSVLQLRQEKKDRAMHRKKEIALSHLEILRNGPGGWPENTKPEEVAECKSHPYGPANQQAQQMGDVTVISRGGFVSLLLASVFNSFWLYLTIYCRLALLKYLSKKFGPHLPNKLWFVIQAIRPRVWWLVSYDCLCKYVS